MLTPISLPEMPGSAERSGGAAMVLNGLLHECRTALKEIRDFPPGCVPPGIRRASELLGEFCVEADSWGLSELYQLALQLQVLLFDFVDGVRRPDFGIRLDQGLAALHARIGVGPR